MTAQPIVAIIGGGPGGLTLARILHVRGVASTVFERDAHAEDRPQGGTLDLHAETGQHALRVAGLEAAFRALARPEDQGDRLYDSAGALLFDHDGEGGDRPEIDRTALRQMLLDSLPDGVVRWGAKVEQIVPDGHRHRVVTASGAETFDWVVGADGAWSRARPLLSAATPTYEGVTFVELGFDERRHPQVGALVGRGKMFSLGDNRGLMAQRNGHGHIRGCAALRAPEAWARELDGAAAEVVRATLLTHFSGWAPSLTDLLVRGEILAVRSLYSLPVGHRWTSRAGLTLIGDAAHLMSPFGGEGVNLAMADAADLAEALCVGADREAAVARFEGRMAERAQPEAQGASDGLRAAISSEGVAGVIDHFRQILGAA
jgi:2-polyprenyl-6-methoxyphenol hydroxylase-like FAD-dependent oxidoreductase